MDIDRIPLKAGKRWSRHPTLKRHGDETMGVEKLIDKSRSGASQARPSGSANPTGPGPRVVEHVCASPTRVSTVPGKPETALRRAVCPPGGRSWVKPAFHA